MLRVAIVTGSFLPNVGGMEYVVHNLSNALQKNGCSVTIFAKISSALNNFKHNYKLIRYGYLFRGSTKLYFDLLSCTWQLLREHRSSPFNVINCHSVSYAGSFGIFANRILRLPMVMTPHGGDIQRVGELNYGIRLDPGWDRKIKTNLERSDAIIAISNQIKKELNFVKQEKIYSIPNGIHQSVFDFNSSKYLHEYLGLRPSSKIVLSIGRNHKIKGYKYGILTFARLRDLKLCNDAVYVIIGKGAKNLTYLVNENKLQSRVFLIEEIPFDILKKCYNSSSIFFSPSIMEGFSLATIEAISSGLPLIVTDVGGNIDIVQDNGCGIIVPSKDIVSMANAIQTILTNDKLCNQYIERALKNSIKYDWANISKMYLNVYGKVIDQKVKKTYYQ
jgi:glycosyltransferase involved in cell wall biosynthesis